MLDTSVYYDHGSAIPQSTAKSEPTWEMLSFYPAQGNWKKEQYLELTDSTNRLIEFVDGRLEFLAMPTPTHQRILLFLMDALRKVASGLGGEVLFSGLRVSTCDGNLREPDVVYLSAENRERQNARYWEFADVVMEVVSPDATCRHRDYIEKRAEYAQAGIPEYWIVDPQEATITVLTLPESAGEYAVHGVFQPDEQATSVLLPGFAVDVRAAFEAGKQQ